MSLGKKGKITKTTATGDSPEEFDAIVNEPCVVRGVLSCHDQTNNAIIKLYDALTVTGVPVVQFRTTKTVPYHKIEDVQFSTGVSAEITIGGGTMSWSLLFEA